jgi:hypothetical protein
MLALWTLMLLILRNDGFAIWTRGMVKLLAAFLDAVSDAVRHFESFAAFVDCDVDDAHVCVKSSLDVGDGVLFEYTMVSDSVRV